MTRSKGTAGRSSGKWPCGGRWGMMAMVWAWFVVDSVEAGNVVVINEIHYNPGTLSGDSQRERQEEEFIELHNPGAADVSLEGWSFSRGVDYTFGAVKIPAAGYLVVAADPEAFGRLHPGVEPVLGPWRGRLSNTSEEIELEDAAGERVDLVEYADSGHWAVKATTRLNGYDHWQWVAPHDGGGRTLELVDCARDNAFGQAWAPSLADGGTPGRANSVARRDEAPFVGEVEHHPPVPKSSDPILIRAGISADSQSEVSKVCVLYRIDGASRFQEAALTAADGGAWTGTIPPQRDGAILEYLIEATSSGGATRRWPELTENAAVGPLRTAHSPRQALLLLQVDDRFDPASILSGEHNPLYRVIMPQRESALLRSIAGRSSANAVLNNRVNATFISIDPAGARARHLTSIRIRGHGSRAQFPPGLRVSFPSDASWKGVKDINLNSQHPHSQVLGAAIHQLMGFPAARATAVRLTINGEDWTQPGLPQFGHYTCNEVLDSHYVESRFPAESEGNLYRGVGQANLNFLGDQVSRYRPYYNKRNNAALDDFSDILQLCRALDRDGDASIDDAQFLAEVNRIADVDQWMRYFALDTLLCNLEGGFPTGRGDDYALFRGGDGRFRMVPYDLDSILGRGDPGEELNKSIFAYGETRGLRRLFRHPQVLRMYFRHIRELVNTGYRPEVINRLVDEVLGNWVPEPELDEIKAFVPRRIAAVLSQIEGYTVAGSTLAYAGGMYRTEGPEFLLYGRFDPAEVMRVEVNGRVPTMLDLRSGSWMMRATAGDPLVAPGITPVLVELQDAGGNVVDRTALQVWYDNGKVTEVAGALAAGETRWDTAGSPYLIAGALHVPAGSSLHVAAGTTVFCADGASLLVSGTLTVEGTAARPVRFAPPIVPGSGNRGAQPATWRGMQFARAADCHITHAAIHGASDAGGMLRISNTRLALQDVEFGPTDGAAVVAADAELALERCRFEPAAEFVRVSGGGVTIEDCRFAEPSGAFAITVKDAAPAVARVQGCMFSGGGGSGTLHLAADALVLQNLFGSGNSPAAAGILASGQARLVVAGNGFLGWDAALSVDAGAGAFFCQNTCRFSGKAAVVGNLEAVETSDNLIASDARPVAFAQPDSAWIAGGGKLDWKLLEPGGAVGVAGARAPLLTVHGLPPAGVAAPGPRTLTFRYPGAAAFRLVGAESLPALEPAGAFRVSCTVAGHTPLGIEVTDLTGRTLTFPGALAWEVVPGHVDLMLSEILAVNSGSYRGGHGLSDAVEVHGYGSAALDISGFRLSDDRDDPGKFVFPRGTVVAPGGYLVVDLGVARPGSGDLAAEFALDRSGEHVFLFGPADAALDEPIDAVEFGPQIAGFSVGAIAGRWQLCLPTLGTANTPAASAGPASVRLNEWLAAGGGSVSDDFVELRNTAPIPADISGFGITDNLASLPFRHRFPPLSFLPGDGVAVFYATGKSGSGQLGFKLSADGEVVVLLGADGTMLDYAAFRPQPAGCSQGRDASGNLVTFPVPTPGIPAGSLNQALAEQLAASLRVSEVHYHPAGDEDAEFVELANTGQGTLDLAGVRVAGGIRFLFQEGASLDSGQRLVLVRSRKVFRKVYGDSREAFGEYSGKLGNGGESLQLVSPEGIPIQQIKVSDNWYASTDGGGKSLEAVAPEGPGIDWSRAEAWRPSEEDGGTPGR